MFEEIFKIGQNILIDIFNIWPYLVLTIPLSVAIHVSGISKNISKFLTKNGSASILLATIIGSFSPFCSCGVIPIIASLLMGGVPLAPIMSFWIASPSMDPEVFFLSVSMLGWDLALWRLISTFIISLSAGYLTQYLYSKNWFGNNILITDKKIYFNEYMRGIFSQIKTLYTEILLYVSRLRPGIYFYNRYKKEILGNSCCSTASIVESKFNQSSCSCTKQIAEPHEENSLISKVVDETVKATFVVLKFMGLAFLIKALVNIYVPEELILELLGNKSNYSIIVSTFVGIPFYANNLIALPMIGSFIDQGMSNGAALAFLIAGPITTLPAMAAVWGITNKKVFLVYLAIPIFSAIIFGYLVNIL